MKSVMKKLFSEVPKANIPRSSFDRSCGYKTTFDANNLIPIFVDEALPGDTFNLKMTTFARLSTPIVPIMDNLYLDYHFFAVPNRLVWDNWKKFNGEQTDPDDSTDFIIPYIVNDGDYSVYNIYDYMGLPGGDSISTTGSFNHSALPLRAYNLIWNEWYRDENLQDSVPVAKTNGPDTKATYVLLPRNKRHDYFTSCLPWPQKGPTIRIPGFDDEVDIEKAGSGTFTLLSGAMTNRNMTVTSGSANMTFSGALPAVTGTVAWDDPYLKVDLSDAADATINALRQAFQIQKLYERDARGGTRYTEIIRSHFGVISSDARLQRPEYLGGGSSQVTFSPIAQTAPTGTEEAPTSTPQGNLAAMATSSNTGVGFIKSFEEHCIIIGLVSVRADLTYQRALDKMWTRSTRFDFYWPALSHIGEQAVLNQEIFLTSDVDFPPGDVFGYQERYAEYRYKPSKITGLFRSNVTGSLDIWTLSEALDPNLLALNDYFIRSRPPLDRTIAVPTEPHFLFDAYFSINCVRPMPVYSVPGYVDHF